MSEQAWAEWTPYNVVVVVNNFLVLPADTTQPNH